MTFYVGKYTNNSLYKLHIFQYTKQLINAVLYYSCYHILLMKANGLEAPNVFTMNKGAADLSNPWHLILNKAKEKNCDFQPFEDKTSTY